MKAGEICLYLALGTGFVYAQRDDKPEIRGTVIEPNLNIGVAGAEITLFEFLLDAQKTVTRTQIATTSTGTRGEFQFPLDHFGEYLVGVKKEGYSVSSAFSDNPFARADVNRDHPTQDLHFFLSQPGAIAGRVVDEDRNPVAGRRVGILLNGTQIPADLGPDSVTGPDGSFRLSKLPTGQYSVRISPKTVENVTTQFSADDLKIVDQDFDSAPSAPVPVSPGATSSAGTITVRKVPYYRARVSVAGADCSPDERVTLSVRYREVSPDFGVQVPVPCGKDFLVRNLIPGPFWFTLRTGKPQNTRRWALAEVEITRENVEVSMVMSQTAEIHGRFIALENGTLPNFQKVGILLRGRFDSAPGAVDTEGKFTAKNLWGIPYGVSVQGLGGGYYVKEIRYNGVVMADCMITPVSGAPAQNLEIVLDDKPATITGSVHDGDKPVSGPFIVAVKWPFTQGDIPATGDGLKGDQAGRFQVPGLAPGEYRVMALSKIVRITELSSQLLNRAEKVTLERGSLKDITLKLVDLSQ
jgi:hypothetical protein